MRVLAVGDSYIGVAAFERGLARLKALHELDFIQLDETRALVPATDSERGLREYAGTPDQIVDRMGGGEALVVHGAPVSAEVLDASPELKLVCCARGGPVNVDVAAASARAIPVVTTPGKNAESVADQTIGFMIAIARVERTLAPDEPAHAAYEELYERWRRLYAGRLQLSVEGLTTPLWRAAGA